MLKCTSIAMNSVMNIGNSIDKNIGIYTSLIFNLLQYCQISTCDYLSVFVLALFCHSCSPLILIHQNCYMLLHVSCNQVFIQFVLHGQHCFCTSDCFLVYVYADKFFNFMPVQMPFIIAECCCKIRLYHILAIIFMH